MMHGPIRRINSTYRGKPTHHYKIGQDRADGVTTALGKGLPKPALLPWGIRSVAEYAADHLDLLVQMQPMGRQAIVDALKQSPYTQRDEAANRGTEVHNIAEQLIHGREVDVPEELAGHVESCVRFLDDWQPTPVLVEAVVANRRWGYAGTLDFIADLPSGQRAIFDYKTSRSGIFGETALQAAAYVGAEVYLDADGNEHPMIGGITAAYGVWIRADGYDVIPLEFGEHVWKAWLHVLYVARQADAIKKWTRDPVAPPEPALPVHVAGDAA